MNHLFKTEQEFRNHPYWKELYEGMSEQELQDTELPLFYIVQEMKEEAKRKTLEKNLLDAKALMNMRCRSSNMSPDSVVQSDLKVLNSVIERISNGLDDFMSDNVRKTALALKKSLDESPRVGSSIQCDGYAFVNWYLFVLAKTRENRDLQSYMCINRVGS